MAKNPFPNPDFIPWSPERQDEYLRSAYEIYSRKCGNPWARCHSWRYWTDHRQGKRCPECPPIHKPSQTLLEGLYDTGRLKGHLHMPFREFEAFLLVGERPRYRKLGHHYLGRDGILVKKEPSKYQRKPTPRPELSAEERERRQSRLDWRKKKQFTRDRARQPHFGKHRTWCKRHSNHIHRRWERRQIIKGDWDNQISDFRKWTHDPYMWD